MEKQKPTSKTESNNELAKAESPNANTPQPDLSKTEDSKSIAKSQSSQSPKNISDKINKKESVVDSKVAVSKIPKKPAKPPKVEDKPFKEFISDDLIPGLKSSIEEKGASVSDIKLIEGERPVVGGKCWMVFCEVSEQRRFWLCFSKNIITSDKTILLAESNSDPSIVESFLIDEKKTTLALLISRVLQRLNGQKWIGAN